VLVAIGLVGKRGTLTGTELAIPTGLTADMSRNELSAEREREREKESMKAKIVRN
jgi:hypothetical protein